MRVRRDGVDRKRLDLGSAAVIGVVQQGADGALLQCARIVIGIAQRDIGGAVQILLAHANFRQGRLRAHGARNVSWIHTKDRARADGDEELLAPLRAARGVWLGGGRQWNFVDSYQNTTAHALLHAVLERGGVIGGSSAGASIQASFMVRGSPLGNREMMSEGYERGLGPEAAWVASTASSVPVFPIGGIDAVGALELAVVGRAAVGAAILCAEDPGAAARALRASLVPA